MNGHDLLAEDLRLHLRDAADERPVPGQLEIVLSQTARIHPRPGSLVALRRGARSARARADSVPALRLAALAALLALVVVLAAVFIGGEKPRVDGLLAFSRDGAIFLAMPDGTKAIRVAQPTGLGLFVSPRAWSPDGRYLALGGYPLPAPDYEPPPAMFVLDIRTLELRRVGEGLFAGWTPESHAILTRAATTIATYAIGERANPQIEQVESEIPVMGAVLSPDGRWLAAMRNRFLDRVDVHTGATMRLYVNGADLGDVPSWSPDSSRIAFAGTLSSSCHTCMGPIFVANVDGSNIVTVSEPGSFARLPKWSPDGRWLAYAAEPSETGVNGIRLVHPDGSEGRMLPTGQAYDLAWSPDGSRIRYQSDALEDTYTRFALFEIGLTDGGPRRLDDGVGVEFFSWQSLPAGSSISPLPHPGRS